MASSSSLVTDPVPPLSSLMSVAEQLEKQLREEREKKNELAKQIVEIRAALSSNDMVKLKALVDVEAILLKKKKRTTTDI